MTLQAHKGINLFSAKLKNFGQSDGSELLFYNENYGEKSGLQKLVDLPNTPKHHIQTFPNQIYQKYEGVLDSFSCIIVIFSCDSSSRRATFPSSIHPYVTLVWFLNLKSIRTSRVGKKGQVSHDRVWGVRWEVGWVCGKKGDSLRGWVSLWEICWAC